jgi:hypothetical protein
VGTGFDGHALEWISEYLDAFLQPVIPAFHATDPDEALDEVRTVHFVHGRGACLRIPLDDLPTTPSELTRLVTAALDRIALRAHRVDLLLDAGYLRDDRDVSTARHRAIDVLGWAAGLPWRSTALAGGAFPPSLAGIAPGLLARLPRREVDLWRQVTRSLGTPIDFADHGVTHPVFRQGTGRAVANLRYTSGSSWHVVRGTRTHGDPIALCRQLSAITDWTAGPGVLSWGDRQLRNRARGAELRPGGPRNWRAWETSRHLAAVAAALDDGNTL